MVGHHKTIYQGPSERFLSYLKEDIKSRPLATVIVTFVIELWERRRATLCPSCHIIESSQKENASRQERGWEAMEYVLNLVCATWS